MLKATDLGHYLAEIDSGLERAHAMHGAPLVHREHNEWPAYLSTDRLIAGPYS